MKKTLVLIILFLLFVPVMVDAKSGCCSHHGGVDCTQKQKNGRVVCNDGWKGSSCYYNEMKKCAAYIIDYREEDKFVEVEDKVEYISKVEKEDESFNILDAEHSDGAFVSNILSAHNILPNNGNSDVEFPGLYKNFGIVFWFGNVYSGLDNSI